MKKLCFCSNWTCRGGEKAHTVIIPHDAMQKEWRELGGAFLRYFKGGV